MINFNPIIVLFLTMMIFIIKLKILLFQSYYSLISNNDTATYIRKYRKFQSYYSLISNTETDIAIVRKVKFQSYYSLISNRPHFFSKRAKTIYNLFIHTLKFVDNKKCFLFICINKQI